MSALHVRNVPDPVLAALRRRARKNGRSMQQEMLRILDEAAHAAPPLPRIHLVKVRTRGRRDWSRETIYGDDGR